MNLETERRLNTLAKYLYLNMSRTTKQSFINPENEIFLRVALISLLRSSQLDVRLHEDLNTKITALILLPKGVQHESCT